MLWRKLRRDLWQNRSSYLACIAVIMIGLVFFSSTSMVIENLDRAKSAFYQQYHFADGFAELVDIPAGEIQHLSGIEGVAQIEGQMIKDVRVVTEANQDNVTLRLVSFPANKKEALNGVKLIGEPYASKQKRQIWLDANFLKTNNLKPHDHLSLLINGKKVDLIIAGSGQSPSFIYALGVGGVLFTSPKTFGIGYIPDETIESLFSNHGSANLLSFTLKPGVSNDDVEERLKPRLEKYGLKHIYSRKDHTSDSILSQKLNGLRSMAASMPILFLLVAAAILYIVLKRMVEIQRGQIGILKAFGFANQDILFHYLSHALIIGLIGGLLGGYIGVMLASPFTAVYEGVFNLPGITKEFSYRWLLFSMALSVSFCLLAGFMGCRSVLQLSPAEAMRPPAPLSASRTILEKVPILWRNLTIQGKMALRNVFRKKQRSFSSFLGIMLTFSLMAIFSSFQDGSREIIETHYGQVETYDGKMTFVSPQSETAVLNEIRHFPGIKRVEGLLEAPVEISHNWHKKEMLITGIEQDSHLFTLYDEQGERLALPGHGIILSSKLAEELGARVGSLLQLKSVWANQEEYTLNVSAIVPESLGVGAYMDINALERQLGQGKMVTSVVLSGEHDIVSRLFEKYRNQAMILSMDDKARLIANLFALLDSYNYFTWIMLAFAAVTGFAIVYNTSMISLAERQRELASLRVIGMTSREVLSVITLEQWFIGTFAILCGLPVSILLKYPLIKSMDSDLFNVPIGISAASYTIALLFTVVAILLAHCVIARKIRSMSMIEVLKDRE
ncbi:ABC transporter permease [Brevibacillus ginsengisoli]|uniref:ABC transporter permease n=1 Tax=Brevibacillus ginsengisoli TaxID=363854 RepID=UPI003CE8FDDA